MSTRVNLIPRDVKVRGESRRSGVLVGVLILALVVGLGFLWYLENEALAEAEQRRDDQQMVNAQLEAEIAELESYARLQASLDARNALLANAMADEISFTRVLNDLALAFPGSSSLLTLDGTLSSADPDPPPGSVTFGDSVASLTWTGYSIERVAPGVEAVVVEFDRVATFFNTFVTTASGQPRGEPEVVVAEYQGSVQLSTDALTNRYVDGLPEEDRP